MAETAEESAAFRGILRSTSAMATLAVGAAELEPIEVLPIEVKGKGRIE
jgi:uncharacterized ParB-like nuclease family protein